MKKVYYKNIMIFLSCALLFFGALVCDSNLIVMADTSIGEVGSTLQGDPISVAESNPEESEGLSGAGDETGAAGGEDDASGAGDETSTAGGEGDASGAGDESSTAGGEGDASGAGDESSAAGGEGDAGTEGSESESAAEDGAEGTTSESAVEAAPVEEPKIELLQITGRASYVNVNSFAALKTLAETPGGDYVVVVDADIPFESTITVNATTTIYLMSTGADLTLAPTFAGDRHFVVRGNLKIYTGITLDGADPSSPSVPHAGGVSIQSGGSFILDGATIQNCRAPDGGGVYASAAGGMFNFLSGRITNCVADEKGGGIFFGSNVDYWWNNGTIDNCESYSGGGIYLENASDAISFSMEGTATITQCKALSKYSSTGNRPQGGGIYVNRGTLKIVGNSKITDCLADAEGQGGGVFTTGGPLYFGDGASTPLIEGCIAGSKLDFDTGTPEKGLGGGIYSITKTYIYAGSLIENCHASNNGGGAYITTDGLTMYGGTIKNCTASNGGGMHLGATTTIQVGTIENCKAFYQGGGAVVSNAAVTFEQNVLIRGCSAGTPNQNKYWGCKGGGVFVTGGAKAVLTLNNSIIENCHAVTKSTELQRNFGSGGGIYVDTTGRAVLNGAIVRNCSAQHHGGGIFTKKYSNLTTDADVIFTGNYVEASSQPRYRIPADTIVNNPSIYPCTSAYSVSPSAAQLENRMYPLNNWDINYSSYKVVYDGNGGLDGALGKYEVVMEYAPFATTDNPTSAITYTVLSNDRASNGNLFEFSKTASGFGTWANVTQYQPSDAGYKEYGPAAANPTESLPSIEIFSKTKMPELTFYALYTKKFTVKKNVVGAYADLTKAFDIDVTIRDAAGQVIPNGAWNLSLKHGDTKSEMVYEDCEVTITENLADVRYTVTYNDGGAVTSTYDNQSLKQPKYDNLPEVAVVVENTLPVAVPTGVSTTNVPMVLIVFPVAGFLIWIIRRWISIRLGKSQ